jgi:hypothetical protein
MLAALPRECLRDRASARTRAPLIGATLVRVVSLTLAVGCTDVTRPARAPTARPGAPATPTLPSSSPPQMPDGTAPGVLYQRVSPLPLSYGASDAYWLSSGADSTFLIVFPDGTTHWGWSGRYTRADSVLRFRYNAWSAGGELSARGIVRGDTLVLAYNPIMQMTDFEDGVYVRTPRTP